MRALEFVKESKPNLPDGGDCFESALEELMYSNPFGKDHMDNMTLVHAIVTGQGKIEGLRYGHAWNEIGDVVVVAPDSPQSGMGHAVTINETLYCNEIKVDEGPQKEYKSSGTPADCIKLAVSEILDRKPDLCVSGINHGSNSSINVIYSGTMSAAVEAGVEGIPAIGFSLLDYSWNANFNPLKPFIKQVVLNVLENGLPDGVVLNVNFPKLLD